MKKLISIIAAMAAISAHAAIELPDIMSDNMVLQQQSDAKLWGWSNPGAKIIVTTGWNGKAYTAKADKKGRWEVAVATPEASYTPYTVTMAGDGSNIELKNVLVGEVWFCSGQSNMEMPLKGFWCQPTENGGRAIAYSGKYPGIRMANINRCGNYELQDRDVEKEKATPDSVLPLWERINVMYNAMLHPLAGYTVKGFLWNQGEANVGQHTMYPERLRDMVQIWRDEWKQGELPFYYVEIPAWNYGDPDGAAAALFRECQHKAADIIPNSGCVSTTDLIYPHEINDIHGTKKEEIGERLSFMAAARTYGIEGIDTRYPRFKSMHSEGSRAVIMLDNVDNGLTPNGDLEGFEVAGDDHVFYPAKAKELWYNRAIEVSSDKVKDIKAVRYCFRNFSIGRIHNHLGLPLLPFRTDDWEESSIATIEHR